DDDREAVVRRSRQAGVEAVVCVGISATSSRAAISLAEQYPYIYAAVGIQPNYCGEAEPGDWDRVVAMADHPRVVAVGETGLDRYWDFTPMDVQQDYFDRHLELARQRDLPVVIHCRDAEDDLLPMLRAAVGRGSLRGVLHSFSGDAAMARQCLDLGLFISFSGMVTYTNKKLRPLRDVAATIPDDRILIETDSPYLVPHPLRGKQKRNEPAHVSLVAECLAGLRDTDVEQFAAQTVANARRLFRLP
ncbi:MAG: TatD family hydrolase, partial [Candidatus Nealsonbacteria bacterium]|nr:TatD family hydrolase [Candidatus Nealsonbacteria bacterium]